MYFYFWSTKQSSILLDVWQEAFSWGEKSFCRFSPASCGYITEGPWAEQQADWQQGVWGQKNIVINEWDKPWETLSSFSDTHTHSEAHTGSFPLYITWCQTFRLLRYTKKHFHNPYFVWCFLLKIYLRTKICMIIRLNVLEKQSMYDNQTWLDSSDCIVAVTIKKNVRTTLKY